MPDPVTGLSITFPAGVERAHLSWTNPGTTFDGNRVSMKPSASSTWAIQYLNVPITSRYLYPLPGVAYDYRVETTESGVFSTPVTLLNQTLPWWCDEWGLVLADTVDPTLWVPLGLFNNFTDMRMKTVSEPHSYRPMGSPFPKDFPSRAKYRQLNNQFSFAVPAAATLSNGTVIDNEVVVMTPLRLMAPNRYVIMQWRDAQNGVVMYVAMLDYDEEPAENGWTVYLTLEERKPPTFPIGFAT